MLDARSPACDSEYMGSLIIQTYRINNKPVGFIAYYPKELLEGYILFLAVAPEYRSRGLARKMMHYAIVDLKQRGMRVIRLIARVDNEPGRKLYASLEFKRVWTDGAYVKFQKDLRAEAFPGPT